MRLIRFITLSCIFFLSSFATASGSIFSYGEIEGNNSQINKPVSKESQYYFSGCSFHHNQPADSTVNISCTPIAQAVKNYSFDITALQYNTGAVSIPVVHLQYYAYSRYIDPALTGTSIIFPFHYFW